METQQSSPGTHCVHSDLAEKNADELTKTLNENILAMKGMKRFGILLLSALAYQAEVGFFEHGALSKKRTSTLVTILV